MPPQAIEAYRQAFEANALTREQFTALLQTMVDTTRLVDELRRQVEWFKRQLFGHKSERRLLAPDAQQGTLGQAFDAVPQPPEAGGKKIRIDTHERVVRRTPAHDEGEDLGTFFDAAKVPVEVIELPPAEVNQLAADQYEVVSQKVSYRLAQRPGSYVVLKYVRPVIKRRDTQALLCAPAPAGVLEGSRADVSFIAGMMVDKLVYHLPLYRQHQRLQAAGLKLSRQWLTQLMQAGADLLAPIHEAQRAAVLARGAQGDGRDADQGWSEVSGQDESGVLLADLWRAR